MSKKKSKKSSSHTSSPIQLGELAKGAGIGFIFGIFGYIIMFFFRLIAARYFGPTDFGIYTLSETVLFLCSLVAAFGIPAGIPRYLPYYKYQKKRGLVKGYLNFTTSLLITTSLFLSLLIYFFAPQITAFFNFPEVFVSFLRVVAFAIPLHVFGNALRQVFVAEKNIFFRALSYHIIEKLPLLIGTIIIWLYQLDIFYLICLLFGSLLFTLLFEIFLYKKYISPSINTRITTTTIPKYEIKDWLNFSLPLLFMGLFAFLISWTDNLVIGKFLGPERLGIYSIAYSFAMFLGFFQVSLAAIFLPLIAEHHAKKQTKEITLLFKKAAAWVFGLTFPFFLVMTLYAYQVLTIFYGKAYGDGYIPLIIVSMGFLINVTTGLNAEVLTLHKRTQTIFLVSFFIALANLLGNIFLVPTYGLIGAAISSALAMSLQNIILLLFAKQSEKLSFDYSYIFKFILAGVPAVLVASSFFRISSLHIISAFFLSATTYCTLYLLLLLLFRTFTNDDFKVMLALEKRIGINLSPLKNLVKYFYKI